MALIYPNLSPISYRFPKSEIKSEPKSAEIKSEHKSEHKHHEHHEHYDHHHPPVPGGPSPIEAIQQVPLTDLGTTIVGAFASPVTRIKVPVVIAEPTLQIVVESNIHLHPAATEIKRVKKNVFLKQVKLIPVGFARVDGTDFFLVNRAKVFVSGHIRKNIEYASHECNGVLQDRIVDVPFTGFTELTAATIINPAIIGIAESAEANFLNEQTNLDARLDKFFFQNLVKYNEQPFGELVAANFFELDFSPEMASPEGTFCTLREKIVLDLTIKVLQTQQLTITATSVVPMLTGLTPPVSP